MITPYTNLYASLNPHLKPREPRIQNSHTYIWSRNPPHILCYANEIKDRICQTFETTDQLFKQHTVTFPFQQRELVYSVGIPVIDVNYLWSTEYFHFLTEVLPNVLFLKDPHPIYCQTSPFTLPLFRWFGIQNSIISSLPKAVCRIKAKYVECGNPSPEKLRLLRNVIESKVKFERQYGILIHRQKSRALLNESDVLVTLQTVYPSIEWKIFDLPTIEETIDLFSKAAIIVGSHGAGMTNMLFSSSGIPIVEFMPLEQPNVCYWHLSEVLGNRYYMIPCPSEQDYCMQVDCAKLIIFLNQSIGKL